MTDEQYQVDMRNISKRFEGVHALKSVDLKVKAGEIHAVVGENGAGKSTLMKILSGAYTKDSGEIYLNGKKVEINNPRDGREQGIAVIYQDFALVSDLSVAENIFIKELSKKRFVDWKELRQNAQELLDELGFGMIDVDATVSRLSVAYQQVIEICKALTGDISVLVLDEPTAVLASNEIKQLFDLIRKLRDDGVAIIYISHRLEEVFEISERITVMKDGKRVDTVETLSTNEKEIANMMVGRKLSSFFPERESDIGEKILEVKNIRAGKAVIDVSFNVKEGEVLGLSGLVGSGRTEALRAIFGADKMESGEIYLNGEQIIIKHPKKSIAKGVAMLPEDRKEQGVLLGLSVKENITLSIIKSLTKLLGWINKQKELDVVNDLIEKLRIKTSSVEAKVASLSGGNQQKVAISKLLATDSKVLLLDEPTRGVDVGAKIEIYKIINSLVKQDYAVIMVSSEMMEIIGMCDRTVVFREGKTVGELSNDELTEENIIGYSMGVRK